MYRVFNDYQTHLPPYAGAPPLPLREDVDYQKSWGTTYYDSEWQGLQGHGAMEEHYEKYCLPIFPFANNYTCSFISLGDAAFFVTYDDRPSWMPPVCLFSPHNHPPERDFIKHLPYAVGDSRQLNFAVQGYSFWVSQSGAIMQTGAAPDQTQNGGILFGYAFDSQPTPDRMKGEPPYRHPQSFYFLVFRHRCQTRQSSARTTPTSRWCGPTRRRPGRRSKAATRPNWRLVTSSTTKSRQHRRPRGS